MTPPATLGENAPAWLCVCSPGFAPCAPSRYERTPPLAPKVAFALPAGYVKQSEAVGLACVSTTTIGRACRSGAVRHIRHAKNVYVCLADVQALAVGTRRSA